MPRTSATGSRPPGPRALTRLIGRPVSDLRPRVRAELTGTTTCTHLNDTLRSLEDVAALAAIASERESGDAHTGAPPGEKGEKPAAKPAAPAPAGSEEKSAKRAPPRKK